MQNGGVERLVVHRGLLIETATLISHMWIIWSPCRRGPPFSVALKSSRGTNGQNQSYNELETKISMNG